MITETTEYKAQQHGIAAFAIKKYNIILKDGIEVSRSKPLTIAVNPGDDLSIYPDEIQGMCNGYWTDSIVAKYNVSMVQADKLKGVK